MIQQHDLAHAARLLSAAEARWELPRSSYVVLADERAEYDRNMTLVHAQLDEATFAAAWAARRAMTLEQAIAAIIENNV
jgi:hypothetical protein